MRKYIMKSSKMAKALCSFLIALAVLTLAGGAISTKAYANEVPLQTKESLLSEYRYYIYDEADLFDRVEEELLAQRLEELAAYTNVAIVTVSQEQNYYYSSETIAEEMNETFFGYNSQSVVILIDMVNRNIYIDSQGAARRVITSSKAYQITDNCYTLASSEQYYACADKMASQVLRLFEGRQIASSMKIICSVFLGILIAMLINFVIATLTSSAKKASIKEILGGTYQKVDARSTEMTFLFLSKTYSPRSKGGSSGGSRGGHGGGHSGGHSGGGHHF